MNKLIGFGLILLLSISVAEARMGGGRSMGFRGSSGFGSRSIPTMPARPMSQPNYQRTAPPLQQGIPAQQPPAFGGGGGFMRGMLGGLAGGVIGSMLFSHLGMGSGFGGMPGMGGGGFGFIEILLLAGLGYFLIQWFTKRKPATETGAFRRMEPSFVQEQAQPLRTSEETALDEIEKFDRGFNVTTFKDQRMDDFIRLQTAWNQRDLSKVSGLIGPELRQQLESDISSLKSDRQINRIENIAVRGTDLIEARAERGNLYVTLRFRANLVDYTVDESTGALLSGDRTTPIKFEEDWTFVSAMNGSNQPIWKLTAIEND